MKDIEKLKSFFINDRYCRLSGVEIESVEENRVVVSVEINETHLNASNGVQGGLMFTMADFAFAILANACGLLTVSTSASISFLRGVKGRTLKATAVPLHMGKRTATCLVTLTDGGETPVASATFDGIRLGENPAL